MSAIKKVVINSCYGGFGLSARATKRWAELKGRECYFFTMEYRANTPRVFESISVKAADASDTYLWHAFDVPNPNEVLPDQNAWNSMSMEERKASNEAYGRHDISGRDIPRDDSDLVRVVEELGEAANGRHASLRIVEIPADVEFVVSEYDGMEHVAEAHRAWS